MDRISKLYIPFFIFLSCIFNEILSRFFFPYIYFYLIIIGIVFFIFDLKFTKKKFKEFLICFSLPIGYVFFLSLIFFIHIFIYSDLYSSIKAFFMYTVYIIYWLFYFQKHTLNDFKYFLISTFPYVLIISFLGCIQFFISPDLFGILSHDSNNIKWAHDKSFFQYVIFFRASSTLGSPQVYSLFLALHIILFVNFKTTVSRKTHFLCLFLLIVSGLLSGSKSFIVTMLLYIIFCGIKYFKRIQIRYGLLFGALIIGFIYFSEYELINRVVNLSEFVMQESRDSRLGRYVDMVLSSNLLIGEGLGVISFSNQDSYFASESYIFQILYECGWIIFSTFLFMFLILFFAANISVFNHIKVFILLLFFSMIYVHAFFNPAFFSIWGVLMACFSRKRLLKNYEYFN